MEQLTEAKAEFLHMEKQSIIFRIEDIGSVFRTYKTEGNSVNHCIEFYNREDKSVGKWHFADEEQTLDALTIIRNALPCKVIKLEELKDERRKNYDPCNLDNFPEVKV